jgi:hypothetical protein
MVPRAMTPERLLARLDAIGQALAATVHARALIGVGSVGDERQRLDQFSDLDFFVIVDDGFKQQFLDDLGWLAAAAPLAYAFRNTADGYKALAADGIFYEFAIFEQAELGAVSLAGSQLVWRAPHVDDREIAAPATPSEAPPRSVEWLIGEALTNLYVGLGRYHRGEKLSAMRFIQGYAVDRVLQLAEHVEQAQPADRDPFSPERRVEQRLPSLAQQLPLFLQGYDRSRESARAILDFLAHHFPINNAMADEIRARCQPKTRSVSADTTRR